MHQSCLSTVCKLMWLMKIRSFLELSTPPAIHREHGKLPPACTQKDTMHVGTYSHTAASACHSYGYGFPLRPWGFCLFVSQMFSLWAKCYFGFWLGEISCGWGRDQRKSSSGGHTEVCMSAPRQEEPAWVTPGSAGEQQRPLSCTGKGSYRC